MPLRLNQDDVLLCAHCGGNNLRHVRVDLHTRPKEDADSTITTITLHGCAGSATLPPTTNPSSRRDGVAVLLSCETCPGLTELRIAQHKGETVVTAKPFG